MTEEHILKQAIVSYAEREGLDTKVFSLEDIAYLMAEANVGDMAVLLMNYQPKPEPAWMSEYKLKMADGDDHYAYLLEREER